MLTRGLALVTFVVVLIAPRVVRAQDDPNFCYTGWYELDREDAGGGCDRVIYHCDMTGASIIEYDCTGDGYGIMY
jgi:hypothetical protein